jgi:hypothetical protein
MALSDALRLASLKRRPIVGAQTLEVEMFALNERLSERSSAQPRLSS